MASKELSIKDLTISFVTWIKFLISKWKFILVSVVACLSLGLVIFLFSEKKFVGKLDFVLGDETASGAGLLPGFLQNVNPTNSVGLFSNSENIIWLYTSPNILKTTLLESVSLPDSSSNLLINMFLKESELDDKYKDEKSPKAQVKFEKNRNNEAASLSRLQNSVIKDCIKLIQKEYLTVNTINQTVNIIGVEFKSKNEILSKLFVEVIVKNANNLYVQSKTKNLLKEIEILETKTDSFRRRMEGDISNVAYSVDAVPYANPLRSKLQVSPKENQVQSEISSSMYVSSLQNLEATRLALSKETPIIQIINRPEYPLETSGLKLVLVLIISILLGLFLSVAYLSIANFFRVILSSSVS